MLKRKTINVNGELISLEIPKVMGILNLTPDSFYAFSRKQTENEVAKSVEQMLAEGADIIDVGAYSTRPNAGEVTLQEELERLRNGLSVLRKVAPHAIVSVDTFRADVARMCIEEFDVGIINDISGGNEEMFATVAKYHMPYILMHLQGTVQTMHSQTEYEDLVRDVFEYFANKLSILHGMGVADVIIDPGFGFSKTLEQNYELFTHLDDFAIFEHPILVGLSRKSMIWKSLGLNPESSLNGTTVLNTLALEHGADILRVHDVREAVEAVKLVMKYKSFEIKE